MNWTAFIDSTYKPGPLSVECQVCDNWQTEVVESGQGKNPKALLRTPGLLTFCDPTADVTGRVCLFGIEDHLFAVVSDKLILIAEDGTYTLYATPIADDGRPVKFAGNPQQLFMVAGKKGYIAQSAAVTQIADPGFPVSAVGAAFVNSRFVTARDGTDQWQCSDPDDGTVWDPVNVFSAEASADYIHALDVVNNEVYPFGGQTIQVFDDTGDLTQIFSPRVDVVINYGIGAPDSLVNIGGDWYFIEGSNRGRGIVMKMSGYSLSRVSDHSVEEAIRAMGSDYADAIGWTYEEKGHVYYVLYFVSADQTWVLDISTGRWHTRSYRNPTTGRAEAHRGYSAACVWGKIFVGDRENGLIYEMSMDYLDDDGDLIHRTRTAPCLDSELENIKHSDFELDGNVGIGLDGVDSSSANYDPAGMLEFSDNNGQTWSMIMNRGFGPIGTYDRLVIWRRLGTARRRVYRFTVSAAVDWAIAACYINKER